MFDDSRVHLVRQALRDGVPLNRIEAYFDWVDGTVRELQSQVVIPPSANRALRESARHKLSSLSGKLG